MAPTPQTIIDQLFRAADDLSDAQRELDSIRIQYEMLLTTLSIAALSVEIFPSKGDLNQYRPALNDKEREIAIEHTCQGDPRFMETRIKYEQAQRKVRLCRDVQENARLISQMMISRLD